MATPPVQIAGSPFATTWTGTGTKTAGGGASVGVGDLVVVMEVNEGAQVTQPSVPSNTGSATVTWTARGSTLSGNNTAMRLTTGLVTGAGTLTVSATDAANNWGFYVLVFASGNHGGVGLTPADVVSTTGTPSLTAAWSAGSLVACLNGDWAAVAITGLAYLTTGIGTPTQINASNTDGNYSTEAFYYPNATGGSAAVGESAPAGQTWTLGAVEVLGTGASASAAPRTFNAIPFMGGVL